MKTKFKELYKEMLETYPGGLSNTSTKKFDSITQHISQFLNINQSDVYATGSGSRPGNLEVRLSQGVRATTHTIVGLGFIVDEKNTVENTQKITGSAIVTCEKFLGRGKAHYDNIVIFVESNGEIEATGILFGERTEITNKLIEEFEISTIKQVEKQQTNDSEDDSITFSNEELRDLYKQAIDTEGTAGNAIFIVSYGKHLIGKTPASSFISFVQEKYPSIGSQQELNQAYRMYEYFQKHPNKMHLPGISAKANGQGTSSPKAEDYLPLLTAIKTKPFLILGGFSGTGKSQKVKELAYLTCPKELQGVKSPGNYALISVKPNWHDSTELLGYDSSIAQKYIVTDFMRFCVKAMQYPNVPFFCCMDEMNLAPVEEYFAEYLSVIESRKKNEDGEIVSEHLVSSDVFTKEYEDYDILSDLVKPIVKKNEDGTTIIDPCNNVMESLKKNGLCIPQNLVVIGTVNMDDTTNSFSRKVIDRAMIFETDIDKFADVDFFGGKDTLQYGNVDGKIYICDEVRADKAIEAGFDLTDADKAEFVAFVDGINEKMAGTSFQVSYRVMNEMVLYYRAMQELSEDHTADIKQVENDILMMKVLPRIEGDSAAKRALEELSSYIQATENFPDDWKDKDNNNKDITENFILKSEEQSPWKKSYAKIRFMLQLLSEGDGFTRFWK